MLQALVCAQDWLRGTSLKNAKACEEESFLEGDTVGEGNSMAYTCCTQLYSKC